MARRAGPEVYSIAAHRGFADALVAGLVPRYREEGLGLARLTLLLPSTRAKRVITEAFIRHFGRNGEQGMLLPRMVIVGDLDLDEQLGTLLDPLGLEDIPRAVDPIRRWLALGGLLEEELGEEAPKGATLLRLAREIAATMDRLLVEEIGPEALLDPAIVTLDKDLAEHWQRSLRVFARVQQRWLFQLDEWNAVDTATRRNLLFNAAAKRWSKDPPQTPIVAAGVTSAAPALARLLRTISALPRGAVILPDLDLSMTDEVWEELGRAGLAREPGSEYFGTNDATTHPQYHLKLLLNRMGIAREEVRPWHRRGEAAAAPERSHAISALFLPPEASRSWASLPAEKRRLSGIRIMRSVNPEEEAQAVALLVREGLETAGKRIAVVTPDRGLARRIIGHLERWNIHADDSAGRPLSDTAAGRLFLLLAELLAGGVGPVVLTALLMHPLVDGGGADRRIWLRHVRALERRLRGPRPKEGLTPLTALVEDLEKHNPDIMGWWQGIVAILSPLIEMEEEAGLARILDQMSIVAEALAGERVWAREDGRALARFVEELRSNADEAGTCLARDQIDVVLRDAMEPVAVRPPWGGHARVAIYGLLESRMSRADLVICAGLNEGVWPPRGTVDALLAPPVLRSLGVPGADFRIGLSAHDLASALGAPEVVLSRAERDESGPAIPSRFLLRVQALLGELVDRYEERNVIEWARMMAVPQSLPGPYPRPQPDPTAEQRDVGIAVTALDRLRGDPYQFYASSILGLRRLDALEAEPSPAWQGEIAHLILQRWHEACRSDPDAAIAPIMNTVMEEKNAHPLMRGLWEPRLLAALEWVAESVRADPTREAIAWEIAGEMIVDGVRIHGRADRIDRLADDRLAIIDYKTGSPPSKTMVEQGFALQLGLLGLMAEAQGFTGISGQANRYEYWSLAKSRDGGNAHGFGYIQSPLKTANSRGGIEPEDFLPLTRHYLQDAIRRFIKGSEAFTARLNPDYPGYADYDQLMRLEEWLPRLAENDTAQRVPCERRDTFS